MTEAPDVLCRIEGRVGRITLNRPKALHALTTDMCRRMTEALVAWRADPAVELVLLDHAGERGFCAGGDIRMLAESGAGDGRLAREFFFTEYRLNHLLFEYPKPTLALMDGVTMGGGVGLAMPCRYRVATERTTFAMPETGIGLFPDVGGGWHLSRMPDQLGLWLALTGVRLKAADCLEAGIATDYVESLLLPELKAAILAAPAEIAGLLASAHGEPAAGLVPTHREEIRAAFACGGVEAIVASLSAGTDWQREQATALAGKSPQTLKVAFRQLRLGGRARDFAENMAIEFRIAARVVRRHDFLEGVRAVIVEKDNAPKWRPARLEEVDEALLDEIFAPLPAAEEWTPLEPVPA
jgi:enoyl-CoA hydratase